MPIFNSLGSNYDFPFVVKSLFATNSYEKKKRLEKFLGEKYGGKVFLVFKGREAIELGLRSLKLPLGSEVAVNGFTCYAVYEAIKAAGLEPIYLDISGNDLHFSPEELEKTLNSRKEVRVVIVQNTLGYPCDIEGIKNICKKHNLILMEDLAHSVGSVYENAKEAGTVGDLVVLSFSQDKMVDGITGGALVVRNRKAVILKILLGARKAPDEFKYKLYPFLTILIRSLYVFGIGKALHAFLKGFNLLPDPVKTHDRDIHKLPEWYCGLIFERFRNLKQNIRHRRKIAKIYVNNLNKNVVFPFSKRGVMKSSNNRFPIFVDKRDNLIRYLKSRGIYVSDIWYDAPISPQRLLMNTNYKVGSCPKSEKISQAILNLSTHINVSEKRALNICDEINTWLKLPQD
jgi:dTDP-4-amino-4,6-dideoxygalactose transaminase